MPRFNLRLKITALVLAAVLAVPWAAAAAPGASRQSTGPGLLQQLWSVLTHFWGDDGCKMDPNGGCATGSAAPVPAITPDSGCKMDPDGRCATGSAILVPAITRDDGCKMDPSGHCLPGS